MKIGVEFVLDDDRLYKMLDKIVFNSPELACLHEAGHAETALSVGARVVEIELYRQEPRSYGRTRVDRTDAQRLHIALGGFAAEYLLFKAGRLLKEDRNPPTDKEFINFSIGNSEEDRKNFFGQDYTGSDGCWPEELDRRFMSYAIGRAENNMRFDLVERLADGLLTAGKLNEAAIRLIINPASSM